MTTTCTRCGRAYDETSTELADPPAWYAERVCPACYAFEQRAARIDAELAAGRLPSPADLDAQVQHVETVTRELVDDLGAARREYADDEALEHDLDAIADRLGRREAGEP
jgi:predicted  nucleic acid-binding Zn-ribbon protein